MGDPAIPLTQAPLLLKAMGMTDKQLQARLAMLAALARVRWIGLAKNSLRSTERAYVNGILPEVVEGHTAFITLDGVLPNMVERGWYEGGGVDLRETMLKPGAKGVKTSKRGFHYRIIPFRHMGPEASGRNGAPMGSAYAGQFPVAHPGSLGTTGAKALGQQVYKDAKGLKQSFTGDDGKTKWAGRLAAAQGGPLLRPRHATGIYSGMYKVGRAYGKAVQNTYRTFRVISDDPRTMRSDQGGKNWRHPGIFARRFAPRVAEYVQQMASIVTAPQGGA